MQEDGHQTQCYKCDVLLCIRMPGAQGSGSCVVHRGRQEGTRRVGVIQRNEVGGQEGEHRRQSTSMKTLKRERSAQSPGPERCRTESEGKTGEIRMTERGGSKGQGDRGDRRKGEQEALHWEAVRPGSGDSGTPHRGEWQCCVLGTEMLVCRRCSELTDRGERPPWGLPAQSPPLNEWWGFYS